MAIGLDLETDSIKAADISGKDKSLDNYKIIHLDLGEDLKTRLKNGLKKMFSAHLANKRLVNIGVGGPSVVVRYPTLPKMPREELAGAMKFELEQHIPFKKDEVEYDFQVLEEFSPDSKTMKIALAAVKKELIEEKIKTISEAGLKISTIDTNSTALINAFTNSNPAGKGEAAALINIGSEISNINVLKGKEPFLSRDIQFGRLTIIDLLAKDKNDCSLNEANNLLQTEGQREEILELARETLESLINEIRLSFSYYERQFGETISKIYLSGGITALLQSFFQEHLGVPVLSWNPTLNLKVNTNLKDIEADTGKLAVAIGLALCE
ncbi:MAG: hypothetical protein COZ37_01015 [bacterium (Candidatus Ratteibacteria) CG_4_10_14_3_um_filter_41_18]|uniref:SHS2 domain-containing protein n=2 Tax=Candidatus Ratteibacteria TaxID=2979319 RepID=A0A2M7YFS3_9BACT|nr:MAG: hypothetical protein AUJ76_01685 [Candidatus Omnitrophica bacterium CG1_02_41_171]PIX77760.1 MAG: hypothetical protein COZ37_01015 [bacterium (Candidatus Ratteibacteria) CG_4_10_14_3_um_filter_41_18]PJA61817.1 MAG: hypothetical protein CO162_04295 [bacterium (Candidatus Ratteibacteria) CG_4_9_14_3_um_filter_41_21]